MNTDGRIVPTERKVNSGMQPPCEPARMRQRLKQIAIGKSTEGYMNYTRCVPVEKRDPSIHLDTPRTSPESNLKLSKREFEAELRAWRKFLHKYDDAELAGNDAIPGLRIGGSNPGESDSETFDSTDGADWQTGRLPEPDCMYPTYVEPPAGCPPYDWYYPEYGPGGYEYDYEYEPCPYPYGPYDPVDAFPTEPEMPPLAPAPPNPASLVEGTPATNLEALSAQLIALN